MEPALESHLQSMSRKQLIALLQQLSMRHPQLATEMLEIAGAMAGATIIDISDTRDSSDILDIAGIRDQDMINEEVTEDWDFSGDGVTTLHLPQAPILLPLDLEVYRKRIESYATRLDENASTQSISDDLDEVLEEAEGRAEHRDYQGALDLYALMLDERLVERHSLLIPILDRAIDEVMPILETLLSETSSNILFDPSVAFSSILTSEMRQRWLELLFALWLKRLDAHRAEENIPDMMLNIAWSEDIPLLRGLVQNELEQQPRTGHSNIVNLTHQFRIRAVEKFLRELPRS